MILITIAQPADIPQVRALLAALGDRYAFFLLFSDQGLLRRFGPCACKHGTDALLCVLNPHNFKGVVTFGSAANPRQARHLALISCFNELGVPTIEIQRDLFQYGINAVDTGLRVGTNADGGEKLGIDLRCVAKAIVPWGGDDGIGFLPSAIAPQTPAGRESEAGFVLITTDLRWHAYSEEDQYRLVIALAKLMIAHPKLRFVWRPAEDEAKLCSHLFEMVEGYALSNLTMETNVAVEELVPSCSAAISTLSAHLFWCQTQQKPTLVFRCPSIEHLVERVSAATFSSYQELTASFSALVADPAAFLVDTHVRQLDVDKLDRAIDLALRTHAPSPDPTPIVERYERHFTPPPPPMAPALRQELKRVVDSLSALRKQVAAQERKSFPSRATRMLKRWKSYF